MRMYFFCDECKDCDLSKIITLREETESLKKESLLTDQLLAEKSYTNNLQNSLFINYQETIENLKSFSSSSKNSCKQIITKMSANRSRSSDLR